MKAKSIWLGLCLLASSSFAKDFGWITVRFGGEVQGLLVSDSWHTRAKTKTLELDALTVAVTNASGFSYQESSDKLSNYVMGGRITTRANLESGLKFLFVMGFESGMKNANGHRPIDPSGDSVAVTTAEWDAQTSTGVSKWKNKGLIVPAMFVGVGSLSVGVAYDQRQFTITGHDPALTSYLDVSMTDSQYLYGIRAEQVYEWFDKNIVASFEFMTNLGSESDKNTKTYFQNLVKYGTSVSLSADPSVFYGGGYLDSVGSIPTAANRATVYSVNTNLTKISVGFGLEFSEL